MEVGQDHHLLVKVSNTMYCYNEVLHIVLLCNIMYYNITTNKVYAYGYWLEVGDYHPEKLASTNLVN